MRRRLRVGVAVLALAVSQCKFADDPTGSGGTTPTPGTATIALITPQSDDGIVLITLTGPTAPNVAPAAADYTIFTRQPSAGERRVIVVGDLRQGALLTFQVQDLATLGDYRATVKSVASRSDQLRSSLAGYGTNIVGAASSSREGP